MSTVKLHHQKLTFHHFLTGNLGNQLIAHFFKYIYQKLTLHHLSYDILILKDIKFEVKAWF